MTARTRGPGAAGIAQLADQLSERDRGILALLGRHRFLTTRQIERWFFADHVTSLAGARACRRVLRRLDAWRLTARLDRRVGGFRAGSAISVWSLAPAGARLLSYLSGEGMAARVREPSFRFVEHTVAVAEAHLRLADAARSGRFELSSVQIEQESWRTYLALSGSTMTLKPDLAVVTETPEFEDHWFIEVDLSTEHLPTVQKKCQQYQAYRQAGVEQSTHGIFPVVVWLATSSARAGKLHRAIMNARGLDQGLFRVTDLDGLVGLITGGSS